MHIVQSYQSNLCSGFLNKGVMLHMLLLCCLLMCPKCLECIAGASCTVTHCRFVFDCLEMLHFILLVRTAPVLNLLTPQLWPLCTVLPESILEKCKFKTSFWPVGEI